MKTSQFFCIAALTMLGPHIEAWIAIALFIFYITLAVLAALLEKPNDH